MRKLWCYDKEITMQFYNKVKVRHKDFLFLFIFVMTIQYTNTYDIKDDCPSGTYSLNVISLPDKLICCPCVKCDSLFITKRQPEMKCWKDNSDAPCKEGYSENRCQQYVKGVEKPKHTTVEKTCETNFGNFHQYGKIKCRTRSGRQTCVFSCINTDYELFGDDKLRCLKNGTWNKNIPVCVKVTAAVPQTTTSTTLLRARKSTAQGTPRAEKYTNEHVKATKINDKDSNTIFSPEKRQITEMVVSTTGRKEKNELLFLWTIAICIVVFIIAIIVLLILWRWHLMKKLACLCHESEKQQRKIHTKSISGSSREDLQYGGITHKSENTVEEEAAKCIAGEEKCSVTQPLLCPPNQYHHQQDLTHICGNEQHNLPTTSDNYHIRHLYGGIHCYHFGNGTPTIIHGNGEPQIIPDRNDQQQHFPSQRPSESHHDEFVRSEQQPSMASTITNDSASKSFPITSPTYDQSTDVKERETFVVQTPSTSGYCTNLSVHPSRRVARENSYRESLSEESSCTSFSVRHPP